MKTRLFLGIDQITRQQFLVDITWRHFVVNSSISNEARSFCFFFSSFSKLLSQWPESEKRPWPKNFSVQEPLSVSMWSLESQELQFKTLTVSLPVEVSLGRMAYFKIQNMTAFVKKFFACNPESLRKSIFSRNHCWNPRKQWGSFSKSGNETKCSPKDVGQ